MSSGALDSIPRRRLAEQVADELTEWIGADLAVGDRLPSLEQLADQAHVSRTVIREAIGLLESEGTVARVGHRWLAAAQPTAAENGGSATRALREEHEHRSLADRAADAILAMILDEGFSIGDVLPPTRDIVARLGVSIVVVREALANLAARGILDRRQGRGSLVALPDYRVLSSAFHVRGHLGGITDHEFHVCRVVLEREAVRLAATAAPHDTSTLEAIVERLQASTTRDEFNKHDLALHLEIARLSGNRALELLLQALNDLIREHMSETYRQAQELAGKNGIRRTLEIHVKLAKAVGRGDARAAEAALDEHFAVLSSP